MKVTLAEQIAEVQREIESRERAYPTLKAFGHKTAEMLDRQMKDMRAVLVTLQWLQRNEEKIKAKVSQ